MSLVIDNAKFHEIIQEQIAKQKHDHTETKFNHKIYRTIIKKVKRKIRRQVVARKRDEQIQIEEDQRSKDPLYQAGLAQQEEIQKKKELEEEKENERKCQLWHERELLAKIQWEAKQKREQAAKIQQQQQAKTVHALSTKTSNLKIKSTRTSASKIQIEKEKPTAVIGQQLEDQPTHNPFASGIAGIERPKCSFFLKTGVCKYNERCSRFHDRPDVSNTILLLNMYSNFEMQYGLDDEYDADIGLEFEESERYQNFKEFYYDVLPEFEAFGHVVEFKVCSNFEIHLRGNVYVQFKTDDEAVRAFQRMNGRFYGGKMLQCEFVNITNWKNSICGLFRYGKCPKGRRCNFLHVFQNPKIRYYKTSAYQNDHHSHSQRPSSFDDHHRNGREKTSTKNNYRLPSADRGKLKRKRHRSKSSSLSETRDQFEEKSTENAKKSKHKKKKSKKIDKEKSTKKKKKRKKHKSE